MKNESIYCRGGQVALEGRYYKLTAAQAAVHHPKSPAASSSHEGVALACEDVVLAATATVVFQDKTEKMRDEEPALVEVAVELNEEEREKLKLEQLKEAKYATPMFRIFRDFADDKAKLLFPLALFFCLADGAVMPLQGYVLADALSDFYLPYACPADCGADRDDYYEASECWEQRLCDRYRPRGTKSPLKRQANLNASYFFALAGWYC